MNKAAGPRSRAEKTNKAPQAQTPVVSHEIVPGKFNDNDWYIHVYTVFTDFSSVS